MGVEKDEWLSNFRVAIAALPPSGDYEWIICQ
jgi:hypothetical protein